MSARPVKNGQGFHTLGCGCCTPQNGRNLVVCIDDTLGRAGGKCQATSTVKEFYNHLGETDQQLIYYSDGTKPVLCDAPWSRAQWKEVISNRVDMITGRPFDQRIKSAYQWLSQHYRAGDRIFLFGFSRGAYQVRALSAMIDRVGLIDDGSTAQVSEAFEVYRKINPFEPEIEPSRRKWAVKWRKAIQSVIRRRRLGLSLGGDEDDDAHSYEEDEKSARDYHESRSGNIIAGNHRTGSRVPSPTKKAAKRFKDHESVNVKVKVHFVGAWDTMSDVGGKPLPDIDSGLERVCFFRHALALDERRVKLLPMYARGGVTLEGDDRKWPSLNRKSHTKEVWFAGTHSDIGSGRTGDLSTDSNGPTLRWMTYEAVSAGITMQPFNQGWKTEQVSLVRNSLTWRWRPIEYLPIKKLSYKSEHGVNWWPHLGSGRRIQPGQKIHNSVLVATRGKSAGYKPRAQPKNEAWNGLLDAFGRFKDDRNIDQVLHSNSVEVENDLYDDAAKLVADCGGYSEDKDRYDPASKGSLSKAIMRLHCSLMTNSGLHALQEVPNAAEAIEFAFWFHLRSQLQKGRPQKAKQSDLTISIAPDVRLFGIVLDMNLRWPEDGRKVRFTRPGIEEAKLHLQLRDERVVVQFSYSISMPTALTKRLPLPTNISFDADSSQLQEFVNRAERFFRRLHYEPDDLPAPAQQPTIRVEFADLSNPSRHCYVNDEVHLEVPILWSFACVLEITHYGINITNNYHQDLYFAAFTFHCSDLVVDQHYHSPDGVPLKPRESCKLGEKLKRGPDEVNDRVGKPWHFFLPEGQSHGVAYLKIFFSTTQFNASSILQTGDPSSWSFEPDLPKGNVWGVVTKRIVLALPNTLAEPQLQEGDVVHEPASSSATDTATLPGDSSEPGKSHEGSQEGSPSRS